MSIPSSQHHSFDIKLAAAYGVEEAILIHHFMHWIRINANNGRNQRDGKTWTYQTRKEIQDHFPYWNVDRVKYLCEKLVDLGVLVTANYNKSPVDKTLWYAFVDEESFGVDVKNSKSFYERQKCPSKGKSALREGKSASPIPDTITDAKPKIEEREGQAPQTPPPSENFFKDKFEAKIVMTEAQYKSLIDEFGPEPVDDMLASFYDFALSKPKDFKKYQSHVATVRAWIRREVKKQPVEKLTHFNENKQRAEDRAKMLSGRLPAGAAFRCFDTYIEVKISPWNYTERFYFKDGTKIFNSQINNSIKMLKQYAGVE